MPCKSQLGMNVLNRKLCDLVFAVLTGLNWQQIPKGVDLGFLRGNHKKLLKPIVIPGGKKKTNFELLRRKKKGCNNGSY